jgi:hypothetical protein
MFRKFTLEDISTQNQVKSSIQRGIRGECVPHALLRLPAEITMVNSDLKSTLRCVQRRYVHPIPF